MKKTLKKLFVRFFDYNRNNRVELWELLVGVLFPLIFYGMVFGSMFFLNWLFGF